MFQSQSLMHTYIIFLPLKIKYMCSCTPHFLLCTNRSIISMSPLKERQKRLSTLILPGAEMSILYFFMENQFCGVSYSKHNKINTTSNSGTLCSNTSTILWHIQKFKNCLPAGRIGFWKYAGLIHILLLIKELWSD